MGNNAISRRLTPDTLQFSFLLIDRALTQAPCQAIDQVSCCFWIGTSSLLAGHTLTSSKI